MRHSSWIFMTLGSFSAMFTFLLGALPARRWDYRIARQIL